MNKAIIFNLNTQLELHNRPSGAYRIATELRKHNWDIEVCDFALKWPLKELKEFLITRVDKDTKFIGFSQLFSEWSSNLDTLCKFIKSQWPHVTLILGTMYYKNTGTPEIDYYVKGYGELSIIALLKYLFSNGAKPSLVKADGNTLLLSGGNLKSTPWRDPVIIYEDRDFISPEEWLGVEFSRGCKFACAFCNFPELGVKGDYTRDAKSLEYQLKDAHDRFGISRYVVSDETFNDSTAKITKFADVVESLDFDPFFTGFIRGDLLVSRPQEKEELLRMNLLGHYYGVETFNHAAGRSIGKGMNPEKLKQGLIDVKDFFKNNGSGRYRGTIGLIAGLPYESEESMHESEKWLIENWQGEGVAYYPLMIDKPSINNQAKFSTNFSEYGYRESKNLRGFAGMHTDQLVVWENDYTDMSRSSKIVADFERKAKYMNFTENAFSLASLVSTLKCKDIVSLLALPRRTRAFEPSDLAVEYEFLENYVTKKINHR